MKIKQITIKKSRTFGVMVGSKTRFNKVEVEMVAELDSNDTEITQKSYDAVSNEIEKALTKEVELIKQKYAGR